LLDGFCVDSTLVNGMLRAPIVSPGGDSTLYPRWVDFILTSANTWKTPIEDFTLILERPQARANQAGPGWHSVLSFCSPGKVEKIDADHFQVHVTNLVPSAELHIGYFDLPNAVPAGKP